MNTPPNSSGGMCKSCKAPIWWISTSNGKKMPLDRKPETRVVQDPDSGEWRVVKAYVSHFATCPDAPAWRRG